MQVQQERIAAVLGENQQYVSRRVTGSVPWRVDELALVADVLGVEPGDLFPVPAQRDTHQYRAPSARPALRLVVRDDYRLAS